MSASEGGRADIEGIIATWFGAWSDMPAKERAELLATCLTDTATYADRMVHIAGRDAIAAFVAGFVARRPSARFEIVAPIRRHDRVSLVEWRYTAADGELLMDGFEFEELAEDGRIHRAVAFWEPRTSPDRSS